MASHRAGPAFRARTVEQPDVALFRPSEDGGHLNAAGNRLLAEELVRFLETADVLGGS